MKKVVEKFDPKNPKADYKFIYAWFPANSARPKQTNDVIRFMERVKKYINDHVYISVEVHDDKVNDNKIIDEVRFYIQYSDKNYSGFKKLMTELQIPQGGVSIVTYEALAQSRFNHKSCNWKELTDENFSSILLTLKRGLVDGADENSSDSYCSKKEEDKKGCGDKTKHVYDKSEKVVVTEKDEQCYQTFYELVIKTDTFRFRDISRIEDIFSDIFKVYCGYIGVLPKFDSYDNMESVSFYIGPVSSRSEVERVLRKRNVVYLTHVYSDLPEKFRGSDFLTLTENDCKRIADILNNVEKSRKEQVQKDDESGSVFKIDRENIVSVSEENALVAQDAIVRLTDITERLVDIVDRLIPVSAQQKVFDQVQQKEEKQVQQKEEEPVYDNSYFKDDDKFYICMLWSGNIESKDHIRVAEKLLKDYYTRDGTFVFSKFDKHGEPYAVYFKTRCEPSKDVPFDWKLVGEKDFIRPWFNVGENKIANVRWRKLTKDNINTIFTPLDERHDEMTNDPNKVLLEKFKAITDEIKIHIESILKVEVEVCDPLYHEDTGIYDVSIVMRQPMVLQMEVHPDVIIYSHKLHISRYENGFVNCSLPALRMLRDVIKHLCKTTIDRYMDGHANIVEPTFEDK